MHADVSNQLLLGAQGHLSLSLVSGERFMDPKGVLNTHVQHICSFSLYIWSSYIEHCYIEYCIALIVVLKYILSIIFAFWGANLFFSQTSEFIYHYVLVHLTDNKQLRLSSALMGAPIC